MDTATPDIGRQIREFIVTNFYVPYPDQLADDSSLLEAGVVDSTGVFEVVEFLQSTFGIKVGQREVTADNFDTIGRIVAYVAHKRA